MFEHEVDEDGYHDSGECYVCLRKQEVKSDCRCGACCRNLIIEVDVRDAEVEPRIKKRGKPLLDTPDESGKRELIGYMLNSKRNGCACVFLNRKTNNCTIYHTRPLVCRLFSCDGEDRNELVEIGLLPPR